jgi:hypothetical protein
MRQEQDCLARHAHADMRHSSIFITILEPLLLLAVHGSVMMEAIR